MSTASRNKASVKIPLQLVLVVLFVIHVTFFVGLVGYLSFRNGQQAVNNVAQQLRSEISARITEHLHTILDTPHKINQINAQALRQGVLDADDPDVLERYLWEQIQVFDSVTSIYFGNTEGGLVDAGREGASGALYVIVTDEFKRGPFRKYATDSAGNRAELLATVPDFDARTRAWYANAVAMGDAAWSDVYILFTGQDMAVAASRPVYDEQQNLLGVVSSDIFVSHIGDFMKTLAIGETGVGFIVERSGLLVASSTGEQPFTAPDGNGDQKRLHAHESAIQAVRRAAEFLTARFGDYHAITGAQQLEFELDGQRQFLQVTSVPDEHGIDWLVVVVIPESDFMGQISANNRTTALLIGAALILAVIGGVVTAQWITGPISRLNASTQALARGAWDQPIGDEWISEIDALARSFDDMAEKLKRTLESLAAEIAERKRTEIALQENMARYEDLVAHIPVGVYVFWIRADGAMDFEYVSDRWCEIHQLTREAVLADVSVANGLVHPDERDAFLNRNREAHLSQTPFSWKGRFVIGGEVRWLQLQSIPTVMDDGDVRWFGVTQDVTELEIADQALRESEKRFRRVIEGSVEGILVHRETKPLLVNPAYAHIMGYESAFTSRCHSVDDLLTVA
ncbi:MAG TPA: PAS domain S-box protein, partial [Chloroflexi bacterium]|nr:PAS domain S-box protein [Chloroflexota bacterium]